MDWTKEQYEAIYEDGVNILVSAAAGSGKTTVLVTRIGRLITEEQVDVDRFLITTFTNAAASEMRQRLNRKINDDLDECRKLLEKREQEGAEADEIEKLRQKKEFLKRQLRILPDAHIETFHSFSIGIIRDYFFLTDLQPGFTIGDETKISLMKKEVIDSIFERRFREDGDRFKGFLRKYSKERNDERLKESILSVYTSMLSIPRYMEWADERVKRLMDTSPVRSLGIETFLSGYAAIRLREAARCYEEAAKLLESVDAENLHTKASQDAKQIGSLADRIGEEGYDGIKKALESISLNTMRATKDEKDDYEKVKEGVQTLRKEGKKHIDDLSKTYFSQDLEYADEMIGSLHEDTEYFLGMIKELEKELNERKREENIIDFDDAIHYAIGILDDEKAAADYRERFEYIFIDEYQDSNYLQEAIIGRIRRENNLFMVGDIKQSIYRFRLAEPDLFRKKYEEYGREEVLESSNIDLNSNFRSKGNIRRAVNTIFEDVMEGYDEKAALRGPEDGGPDGPRAELHVIRRSGDEAEDEGEREELSEAALISRIIKEHIGESYIDRKGKEQTLKYSDIAVLSRGGRAVSQIERILNSEGIPAYGDTAGGYYETVEVRVFIDLLRIISNMRQDVPLIAVMSAVFFDFAPSELARIRIEFRKGSFCDAVLAYGEKGSDEAIRARIKAMISRIEGWREMSRTLPLEELIRILLYETGYYDYCSSLPVGGRRVSNLRLLIEKAQAFEKTSYTGLYGFLSYIDAMKDTRQKVNEASVAGEGEDAVRVMTVHKSKGLEYPLVILAGAGKRIRGSSSGYDPAVDMDFSIGLPLIDKKMHTRTKTLLQQVISGKKKVEELDEEIRILYVALTRAIDRLIVVGSIAENREFSPVPLKGSFLDMIYPAFSRIEDEEPENARIFVYDSMEGIPEEPDAPCPGVEEPVVTGSGPETEITEGDGIGNDEDISDEIDRILSFRYPYEYATGIRPKYSVTGIANGMKGQEYEEEERIEDRAEWDISMLPPAIPRIPELRSLEEDRGNLSSAEVGTVMHYVMEKIDFGRAMTEGTAYVEEVVKGLHERGALDDREYEVVSVEDVVAFFDDPVGIRAAKAKTLKKEKEFLMQEMVEGEPVIVQGIIDCFFEEDDGLVLIDYKNSRLPEDGDTSAIVDKYREQIRLYKRALEKAEDRMVRESWLYLFKSGEFVRVEVD